RVPRGARDARLRHDLRAPGRRVPRRGRPDHPEVRGLAGHRRAEAAPQTGVGLSSSLFSPGLSLTSRGALEGERRVYEDDDAYFLYARGTKRPERPPPAPRLGFAIEEASIGHAGEST